MLPLVLPRAKGSFPQKRALPEAEKSCSVVRDSSPPVSPNGSPGSVKLSNIDRRTTTFEVRSRQLIPLLVEVLGSSRHLCPSLHSSCRVGAVRVFPGGRTSWQAARASK